MRLKKSLGQHFLKDKKIIDWIISQVELNSNPLIEIGPGSGALTNHFSASNTILFETDYDLISLWKEKEFNVVEGDAVKTLDSFFDSDNNENNFSKDQCFVVSNLPYNASSQIFVKLVKHQIPNLVLMFQKEVADKICAPCGDKNFGRLSLLTALYYDVLRTKSVPPQAFKPPPKIFSTVVCFKLKKEPLIIIEDFKKLEQLTRSIFQFPRKKIKACGLPIPNHLSDKRSHELLIKDWLEILKPLI